MNNNQKSGLLSLFAGLALIILLAGVFLNNIPFNYALFVAISIWILVGVGSRFIGVRSSGKYVPNAGWRNGLVALLSSIGLIVFLAGIFLQLDFNIAFFIALVFWIASGAVAQFLGVKRKNRYYKQYPDQVQAGYHPPNSPGSPSPPVAPNPPTAPKPYYKSNYTTDGPAKNFCSKCGSTMQINDTFCSNCGSSMYV